MISNFEKCKEITMGDDELNHEYEKEMPKEQKDAQHKRLYLLLADYRRIFKDFTENENIGRTSGYIRFKEKLNTYMGNFSERLQGFLNDIYESKRDIDIARVLLKDVLSLCSTFFPKIFLKKLPTTGGIVLNVIPFELYQEPKATVMKKDVYIENIKPKNSIGMGTR